MAIDDFLNVALREVLAGNYPVAMACICTAVDSSAKTEFGGRSRSRCLAFINQYLDIITSVGFGGAILAMPGGTLNVLDPVNPTKTKNVSHVVYDVLRFFLIHEADLPYNVKFTDEAFYGLRNGFFFVPTNFFYALLFAVVASPTMSGRSISNNLQINWRGQNFPLKQMMGNTTSVRAFLGL